VHFWRHAERGRPTVVCVHCWCGGVLRFEEHVFAAASLYRLGFDVALFTMPFHGRRTPPQARLAGQLFPSRNVQRTNEAFGQAVADLRVLMRWLREEQGSGPVGMMGVSLGGYTTALMASLEADLAFAIPLAAPCSFADVLWHHGKGTKALSEAEEAGITLQDLRGIFAVHCPLSHAPKLPPERMLMVWGEGDHIVTPVHQLALWRWAGRPEIYSYPGGHLVHLGRSGYLRRIRSWLRERVLA
jgi:pimeloyl-ACP methyl ester carboxylesterase